jgi:hypothetical protein
LALVIGGLAIVPALGHEALAAVSPKDFKTKVKNFVKKIVGKFFNRGGSGGGGSDNGDGTGD